VATSLFFEVPDASRGLFSRASSIAEWYEAVQAAGVEDAPTFDGQDSSAAWQYSIQSSQLPGASALLYVGDLRSGIEGSSEPVVVFHGRASVSSIARDLRQHGEQFFRKLLARHGHESDVWMYEPLLAFLEAAAARGSAVVVLWSV
jgi:hypothetical protein